MYWQGSDKNPPDGGPRHMAPCRGGAPCLYCKEDIVILVQYSDKFMHRIVLYSIVLRRSQLYCIVNLLLCGYNTIQCLA